MNHSIPFYWRASSWLLAFILFSPIIALTVEALVPANELFRHLWNTVLTTYIVNSVFLILGVGLLGGVLAIPAAWLMANTTMPGKNQLQWLLVLPLAMPSYVIAFIYTDLLEFAGPVQRNLRALTGWTSAVDYSFPEIRSLGGAIFILALVLYPYLYLLARTACLEQSNSQLLASQLLGSSPWQSFFRVSLPMARPAIITGLTLMAMETLGDFATVSYFAVPTLTTAVYDTWLGYGNLNAAAKISALMLLVVMLLVSSEKYSRRKQQLYQKNTGQEPRECMELSGAKKWIALSWCWSLVGLGFLLPTLVLIDYLLTYQSESNELFEYGFNSLLVSGIAATVVGFIALFLNIYKRLKNTTIAHIPARISVTGYALPGNVLAIGVLITLTMFDNFLNNLLLSFDQSPAGLIFSGSIITVIFACVVRFSAIAIGSVESSLGRIAPSLDMASRTLGCRPQEIVKRIHLPLVNKGLLAGLLLVFIESMKELPATLLLRPFNFETLATQVFQYVSDEQLEYAAPSALVLVLVGLAPLILLNRSLKR